MAKQEFIFPPLDNSVQTNVKYDLLAQKWVKSKQAAEYKYRPRSIRTDLNVVGLIFQLVYSLLTLIILSIIELVKWMRSQAK
ncbi:MAG: hypothetical protein Wins2KO_31830 [Winogradskyella sp.]